MSNRGGERRVRLRLRFGCPDAAEVEVECSSPREMPVTTACPVCRAEKRLRRERIAENGGLLGCLACGHPELHTRKPFPVAIGLAVVVLAAVLAPFTRYLSLLVAAAIDLLLYRWLPDVVVCYVCHAEHRGFPPEPRHPRFDREIHERLRYGERAVMGTPMRESGTADAPEPKH